MTPEVSVVMAVHNGEKYLRESIESILSQTYTDFEFIIIDDGSSDLSADIINSYNNERIRLISSIENLGLTRSLNKGLDAAVGKYIARMDCDDVSLPERLAKQVAFMEAHPDVGVCGAWAKDIDDGGNLIGQRQTPVGERLEYEYWRSSPIIHSTAMIRVAHLDGLRYDDRLRYAQDFDLWLRIRGRCKLSNLAEYLLLYRVHKESITSTKPAEQIKSVYDSVCRHIRISNVSYEDFLTLLPASYNLNPIRRALVTMRVAKAIHQPYRFFLNDDIRYTKFWLRVHTSKVARVVKTQVLRIPRSVRYRIKTLSHKL